MLECAGGIVSVRGYCLFLRSLSVHSVEETRIFILTPCVVSLLLSAAVWLLSRRLGWFTKEWYRSAAAWIRAKAPAAQRPAKTALMAAAVIFLAISAYMAVGMESFLLSAWAALTSGCALGFARRL